MLTFRTEPGNTRKQNTNQIETMKTITVTVGGIKGVDLETPESLEELISLADKQGKGNGKESIYNGALQHFLQKNLLKIRSKASEIIEASYEISRKMYVENVEVIPNGEEGYKTPNGKKKFSSDVVIKKESDKAFIDRARESGIEPDELKDIIEDAAGQTEFVCASQRTRGGDIRKKPVAKKWMAKAQEAFDKGKQDELAERLREEMPDVSIELEGELGPRSLALAMIESDRRHRAAREKAFSV